MSKKRKPTVNTDIFDRTPKRYQHGIMILLIFLSFILFFHEAAFQGKTFVPTDTIMFRSFQPYVQKALDEGTFPLWLPYIFSGMPGYASLVVGVPRTFDVTREIYHIPRDILGFIFSNNDIFVYGFYHIVLGIALYILVYYKVRHAGIALFSAVSFSFITGIIIWLIEGHLIKAMSFFSFPLLLALVEEMRKNIKAWHMFVTILVFHLQGTHIQMIYYVLLGLALYYIFFLIRGVIKNENVVGLIKSGVVIVLCGGFALLMSADRYLSTFEYNQYSIRGSAPLLPPEEATGRSGGGLDYDYATSWSFSPQEISTFFIPSFYGFGTQFYEGPLTNFQRVRVNTYFGQMPFTVSPLYMGIILLALAVVGAILYRRDPFVQYLLVLSTLSLLVSFGHTFPYVYNVFYYYMPMFDKFRVPSMILILLQTAVGVLAAYGLKGIIEMVRGKQRVRMPTWLTRTLGILAVLTIISLIGRGMFERSYIELIQSSGTQLPRELFPWMYERMMNDLTVNLFFLLITFGLIALYINKSIHSVVLVSAVTVLSVADLWRIAYRPMEYAPADAWEQVYRPSDAVQFVKQDDSLFRVVQLQQNRLLTDNRLAYHFLEDIHGYHPAKLRVYQDVIDIVGLTNPFVWNLLNVRYIISDRFYEFEDFEPVFDGAQKVMENRAQLPRAWLVDRVEVRQPIEILEAIAQANFDPRDVAFVETPPDVGIDTLGEGAGVSIEDYGIHHLTATVTATGTHFLVLSEIYYPGGWHAYLNNEEIDIIKTNYFMRGVIIPEGEHTLEMKFEPRSFYLGKRISLSTNILMLLFGVLILGYYYRSRLPRLKK